MIERTLFELINEIVSSSPIIKEQIDYAVSRERQGITSDLKTYLNDLVKEQSKHSTRKYLER